MKQTANNHPGKIKTEEFNLTDIAAYFLYKKQGEGSHALSE